MESRTHEIGIRADMGLEIFPGLYVGKVTAALAGDHHLPACLGHLFQHHHGAAVLRRSQFTGCTHGRHKARSASANHYYVCSHTLKLVTYQPLPLKRGFKLQKYGFR